MRLSFGRDYDKNKKRLLIESKSGEFLMTKTHSFHVPVMGTGFTIDTPIKVAHLGIDSVISLLDDILMEKMRKMYCHLFSIPYDEITVHAEDYRAKRITSYLNLLNDLAKKKFEDLKKTTNDNFTELKKYFDILPENSTIKQELVTFCNKYSDGNKIINKMKELITLGSIDVNIMTKLDRVNYVNNSPLPEKFNDAHAAVRGFVNSNLQSSIVFSAGMNPKLYSYLENFEAFFPDHSGSFKKKIVLKVSDFRSALIQGKFLAKKGLWVSEFRVESGLNCGGHAFAKDGFLLAPILEEFKVKRKELTDTLYSILTKALKNKNRHVPDVPLSYRVTAQGGVGTAIEHKFLLDYYQIQSVGWGSPFLLAPDVTTVDDATLKILADSKKEDIYLSNISPLGIPFYNLKGTSKEEEKLNNIQKGNPGSSCPKHYATFNKEFDEKGMCPASRKYQSIKLKELAKANLSAEEYEKEYKKVVEKSCICVGLGTSALLSHGIETIDEGSGVSVCPGPNLAYFSKITTLKEMSDHIYNRTESLADNARPNMFIQELHIYLDYLKQKIEEAKSQHTNKQEKYLIGFAEHLSEGIHYYENLLPNIKGALQDMKASFASELEKGKMILQNLINEIPKLSSVL